MEKPLEIRQFSKKQLTEDRQKTAVTARQSRFEYFNQQRNLEEKITAISQEATGHQASSEQIAEEISNIENQINQRADTALSRFLRRLNLPNKKTEKLKASLKNKKIAGADFARRHQDAQELVEQLQAAKADKTKLATAKKTISDFYQQTQKAWNEYLNEEKQREVVNVVKKYQVIVVHSLHPNWVPGETSLLNQGINWQTKLKIALALEPNIAVSTIRAGDNSSNLIARMGLIIKSGKITHAYHQDAATQAITLKARATPMAGLRGSTGPWGVPEKITEQIEKAITNRAPHSYNELNIESWQTAGFYFCVDDKQNYLGKKGYEDLVDLDEIYQAIQELNLPLYIMKNGELHESKYHPQLKQPYLRDAEEFLNNITGRKLAPEEVLDSRFQISEDKKEVIKQELFTDPPFRCTFPEAEHIKSKLCGEEAYVIIKALNSKNTLTGEIVDSQMFVNDVVGFRANPLNTLSKNLSGETFRKIAEIKQIGNRPLQYFVSNQGTLYKRQWSGQDKCYYLNEESSERLVHDSLTMAELSQLSTAAGKWRKERLAITSFAKYLEAIKNKIEDLFEQYQQAIADNQPKQIAFYKDRIDNFVFHVYGISDRARQCQDNETAEAAFKLASEFMPPEQYQALLKKRFDDNGQFLITEADLA
ncbi:MAG: hypothetical protein M1127_01300 [Patescibacteria group bacterium]|nr:hypothetical protein [Patescibacteria group bacterium]